MDLECQYTVCLLPLTFCYSWFWTWADQKRAICFTY